MQSPKETVTLIFKGVPAEKAEEIKRYVYSLKYQADEKDRIVYNLINANPTTPLNELKRRLRNEHKLQKTVRKIKQIALECGLEFTE